MTDRRHEIIAMVAEEVPLRMKLAGITAGPGEHAGQGLCLPATRIGIEVLRYFGIDAKPLTTLAVSGNAAWVRWMDESGEPPMPDESWSVGIDARPTGRGYPAHLVVDLLDGDILDLDAAQFSRPDKGIHIPPAVLVPMPGDTAGVVDLDDGGVLVYMRDLHAPPFAQYGGWRRNARHAGPVIRSIRDRLRTPPPSLIS